MPHTAAHRHPWTFGFVLGTGFFGLTAMGPIYNTYIPLLLHDLGLSAALIGFVMTWDNWLHLFIPAWAGARSDSTWTRWGRRRPWILAGAPVGMVLFALVPDMRSLAGLLLLLLVLNAFMSVVRAPGLALLGDLFAPAQRSKANGVINLLGGLGAVTALVGSGYAYRLGPQMPFRLGALLMLGSLMVFLLLVRERRDWHSAAGLGESVWARLLKIVRGGHRQALSLLLAAFFSFCSFNIVETWISSFGRFELGLELDQVPFILAVFAGALLVGAIPSGFVGAAVGHRRAMAAGILLLSVLFLTGLFVRSQFLLMLMLAPAGVAWALIIINLFPLLYAAGGEDNIGMFTGLYYTVTSAASIVGPQFVGLLLDWSGQDYRLMWAAAAAAMALALVALAAARPSWRPGQRRQA